MKTIRAAIIGAPGTGKSTLARSLWERSHELKLDRRVYLVEEFARDWLKHFGPVNDPRKQLFITQQQMEREDDHCNFISDSSIFLGYIYVIYYFGRSYFLHTRFEKTFSYYINQLYELVIGNLTRYTHLFYLPPVLEPEDDGIRMANRDRQLIIDKKIKSMMDLYEIEMINVNCDLKDRADFCMSILEK